MVYILLSPVCLKPFLRVLSCPDRCAQVESLSVFRAILKMRVYQALSRSETYVKKGMHMYFADATITRGQRPLLVELPEDG
jgi:hypothetical protein